MRKEENLLDVLMYVFEHHIDEATQIRNHIDLINEDMLNAGYRPKEINQAILWFDELRLLLDSLNTDSALLHQGIRIYSQEECKKISTKARGLLSFLERKNLIDAILREIIINRAMTLDEPHVGLIELKWIILMILYNHPDINEKLHFLEDIILLDQDNIKH